MYERMVTLGKLQAREQRVKEEKDDSLAFKNIRVNSMFEAPKL